jgi:hypothetical protein
MYKLGSLWDHYNQKSIRQNPKKPGRGNRLLEQTDGSGIYVAAVACIRERPSIWTGVCRGYF